MNPPSPRAAGPIGVLVGVLVAACGAPNDTPLVRQGPLGSLRDLVLFERGADAGGPFFLDRFEVTRGDWREFAATDAGAAVAAPVPELVETDDDVLPMAGIDLRQARAFARWRRCRLPRADEWAHARGPYRYPWGVVFTPTRANTGELGLGQVLPVGTFESGRRGDGPYDLIGNVAEWTESVSNSWFRSDGVGYSPAAAAQARLCRSPALSVWLVPGGGIPAGLLVAAGDARYEVVGFAFNDEADPQPAQPLPPTPWQLERLPGDRGSTLGMRLATTPRELVLALAQAPEDYDADARRQLRRFLRRANHAAVLGTALQELGPDLPPAVRSFWAGFLP